MSIEQEAIVSLFVGENLATTKKATLKLAFAEFEGNAPCVYFNGKELSLDTSYLFNDIRLAADDSGHNSGFGVGVRFFEKDYKGKDCTMLTFDVTDVKTEIGYQEIKIVSKQAITLHKAEISVEVE